MKFGGAEKRNPILRDPIGLIPLEVSECSIVADGVAGSCLDSHSGELVAGAFGSASLAEAKTVTGCDSERCLVEKARPHLGRRADILLLRNFKLKGPTNNDLLSNVNIDGVLTQWGGKWRDFYNYNFNMLNYATYRYAGNEVIRQPDTLATVRFETLYGEGYRTAACVINSDVYQGPGKHWMALFVDARAALDGSDRVTVEFFNSSGRPPVPEWVNWMVKTKIALQSLGFKRIELVNCCSIEHQDSATECGVYSLYYIWCRLNGVPPEMFTRGQQIPDEKMFEFRQHLFANPIAVKDGKFSWDEYQKTVRVKWA